jgi:Na+/H+ antiporter NhaC
MNLTFLFIGITMVLSYLTSVLGEPARLVPARVLVVLWTCLLLQMAIDVVPGLKNKLEKLRIMPAAPLERAQPPQADQAKTSSAREWSTILWLLLLPGTVYIIGFLIGIPVWIFCYMKIRSRESWFLSSTLAVVSWGILYGIFVLLIGAPLS